jgi:hypothetical protein
VNKPETQEQVPLLDPAEMQAIDTHNAIQGVVVGNANAVKLYGPIVAHFANALATARAENAALRAENAALKAKQMNGASANAHASVQAEAAPD